MTTFPTDTAWSFFLENRDDIRAVCEGFLPLDRIPLVNGDSILAPPKHSLAAFDAAVEAKDADRLYDIMNAAWLRAPEDRRVYQIPGFRAMCDLLDATVDGFVDDGPKFEDEEEAAF